MKKRVICVLLAVLLCGGALSAAGLLLQPVTGWATEIRPASVLPDNQKNTVVNNNGVYDVYTQRVINSKLGVNQFDKFTLSGGNITNMHFQTNLYRDKLCDYVPHIISKMYVIIELERDMDS